MSDEKQKRGRKPVDDQREQFSLVLPGWVIKQLRDTAAAEGNSVAAVARRAVIKGLEA